MTERSEAMVRAGRAGPDAAAGEARTRILDAAERLIAANGVEGTGLREIARAAGVTQPLINYHFGGKSALVRQVIERIAVMSSTVRLQALDAIEAGPDPLPLRDIVEALFCVYYRPELIAPRNPRTYTRIIASADPTQPELLRMIHSPYDALAHRFIDAMMRTGAFADRETALRAYVTALPLGLNFAQNDDRYRLLMDLPLHEAEVQVPFRDVIDVVVGGMLALRSRDGDATAEATAF